MVSLLGLLLLVGSATAGAIACWPRPRCCSDFVGRCVVAVLLFVAGAELWAEEALPELEIVRSSYIQAVTGIRSIDCQFTTKKIGDTRKHSGQDEHGSILVYRVRYARDQRRRMVSRESESKAGKTGLRTWAAFDGKSYASWAESLMDNAEQGYFAPWGRISPETPSDLNFPETIDQFLGHRLGGGEVSLDRLIMGRETRIVGWEVVGGHRCVHIELPQHAPMAKNPNHVWKTDAWLDPEVAFLPRRIFMSSVRNGKMTREVVIEEFERFEGGGERDFIFLPKNAVWMGGGITRRTTLEKAVVNQPLSDALFRPEFPIGSLVHVTIPGQPDRTYSVGGDEIRKALVAKSTQKPPPVAMPAAPGAIPDARPVTPGNSVGVVLFRVAAWMSLVIVVGMIAWRAFRHA